MNVTHLARGHHLPNTTRLQHRCLELDHRRYCFIDFTIGHVQETSIRLHVSGEHQLSSAMHNRPGYNTVGNIPFVDIIRIEKLKSEVGELR